MVPVPRLLQGPQPHSERGACGILVHMKNTPPGARAEALPNRPRTPRLLRCCTVRHDGASRPRAPPPAPWVLGDSPAGASPSGILGPLSFIAAPLVPFRLSFVLPHLPLQPIMYRPSGFRSSSTLATSPLSARFVPSSPLGPTPGY